MTAHDSICSGGRRKGHRGGRVLKVGKFRIYLRGQYALIEFNVMLWNGIILTAEIKHK